MSEIATPTFLAEVKGLYPTNEKGILNPWCCIAAVAFSASNVPEAIPIVFEYALNDLCTIGREDDALLLVHRMKDYIFKSGMLSGYPKAINAIAALHNVLPEHLRYSKPLRDTSLSTKDLRKIGQDAFDAMYGDNIIQNQLRSIYPDLEEFSTTFAYGFVYSFSGVMTPAEMSFAIVSALIPSDVPPQVTYHLQNAIRNGATLDQVKAVREIAIKVAKASGIVWKNSIPDV